MTTFSVSDLSPTIFRAYDVRGLFGETLTPEVVHQLGLAIGSESQACGEKTVVVGRDGRLSGPVLLQSLMAGLIESGCDVVNIGLVPTPVLYFATYYLPHKSGVMLTGSHNPPQYNGLKIMIAGETLSDDRIQGLYQRIVQQDYVKPSEPGKILEARVVEAYLDQVCARWFMSRKLKVVIDSGNGATGAIAPILFKRLGYEVVELFTAIDGKFPGHHPDPSEAKNLQDLINKVLEVEADIGIAFDGDGDRIGVVTQEGHIIWPDRLLMLFARDLLQRHPGAEIIFDVKCSRHVARMIKEWGGQPCMWKTGHSLIKSKMREQGALLAGEMSGHLFFSEQWYGFDDAMYAGAWLLQILSMTHKSSDELFAELPNSFNTPELKILVDEEKKFSMMKKIIEEAKSINGDINILDGLRIDFNDGFGLIRPSNTTPALVMRFEGDTSEALERIQMTFKELFQRSIPEVTALPF